MKFGCIGYFSYCRFSGYARHFRDSLFICFWPYFKFNLALLDVRLMPPCSDEIIAWQLGQVPSGLGNTRIIHFGQVTILIHTFLRAADNQAAESHLSGSYNGL
jgi:hypothetical protein